MSWEGYQQNLCANGHLYESDVYNTDDNTPCHCGAACVWWNLVDITNGSFDVDIDGNETTERIDGYVELTQLTPAENCTCHCGHKHNKTLATYQIPAEGIGHRA